jgi:putative transposase
VGFATEEIMTKPPPHHARPVWDVYFVTASTFAHRPLFQTDRVARFFLETILHHRTEGKYRLHEFVIMPDHFHLLLAPAPDVGLERVVQLIQGRFAYRLRKELELNLEVWERDYVDHCIRDVEDYERHAVYIWQKPVRARLAFAAECYPYGSACRAFELDSSPQELKPPVLLRA